MVVVDRYVGLTDALIASSNRKYNLSEPDVEGVRHLFHPRLLQAKSLGDSSVVCNSGVLPNNSSDIRWEVL